MGDGVGNKRKFPCRRRRGSSLEGSESTSNTNASRGVVVVVVVLGVRASVVSSRLLLRTDCRVNAGVRNERV